jgi:autophagy-related protein 16
MADDADADGALDVSGAADATTIIRHAVVERDRRASAPTEATFDELFAELERWRSAVMDRDDALCKAMRALEVAETRTMRAERELALARARGGEEGDDSDDAATRARVELTEAYGRRDEASREAIQAKEALVREEMARLDSERVVETLTADKERLERRVRDAEEASSAARRAESQALDEAESQSAMKNAVLGKVEKLEKENAELVERLMEMKTKEAEKMNEINDLYADLLRQKKSVELNARAESLAEASAASMKALSMSTVMSNVVPSKKRHILQSNKGGTHRVALSHDGFTVASAGEDKVIAMFDTNTGARTSELTGLLGAALDVTFSADDSLVLGTSTDCSLQLWDALTGRVRHRLTGHAQKVTSARISQIDAKRAISCSQDRNVKLWDLNRGHVTSSMLTSSGVYSVVFDANEQQAYSGHFDGAIRAWDLRAGNVARETKVHNGLITAVFDTPNQNEILTNSRDNTLKLVDIRTMDVVQTFSAPKYRVGTDWSNPCVSPDGQHIASGGADGALFIWRVQGGRLMTTLHGHDAVVATCAWNAAGVLASACKNGVCLLWE